VPALVDDKVHSHDARRADLFGFRKRGFDHRFDCREFVHDVLLDQVIALSQKSA
jgi:hypothetical protein